MGDDDFDDIVGKLERQAKAIGQNPGVKALIDVVGDASARVRDAHEDTRPIDRKAFLRGSVGSIGGLSKRVGVAVLGGVADRWVPALIRPPGALIEEEFLKLCTRCDACIEACHQDSILKADGKKGFSVHTPYLDPNRRKPCYLCTNPPCIEACPTGALIATDPRDFRMGSARILRETCIAWAVPDELDPASDDPSAEAAAVVVRETCDACVRRCPYKDEAIFLDVEDRPWVDPAQCTGCGLCIMACPVSPKAIVVEPPAEM